MFLGIALSIRSGLFVVSTTVGPIFTRDGSDVIDRAGNSVLTR